MPPKRQHGERDDLVSTFISSATKILAPNSLQFDDNEFERSPPGAKQAALDAANRVEPGDLIFITTRGFLYSMARFLCNNEYDHVVIVLNEREVLHVGPPSARRIRLERLLLPQRQPVVVRVAMAEEERAKFIRCAEQLDGTQYDVKRVYKLMLRLALKNLSQRSPLPKLSLDIRSDEWICSDAVMILLAGCSEAFRKVLAQAKADSLELDMFSHGGASFADFTRLRQFAPQVLHRVPLPVIEFVSTPPQRPWRAYAKEFLEMIARMRSGKVRWHLLEDTILPQVRDAAKGIGHPSTWPSERKALVLAYTVVLLVALKRSGIVSRILVRTSQLIVFRFVVQRVMQHLKWQDVAQSMIAKM